SVRLDHITSSGLGLDDTSQHSRHTRSLRPNPMPVRAPKARRDCNSLLSDNGCVEPPDPIPNSEVKRTRADGSVGLPCESRSSLSIYTARPVPERDRPCSFAAAEKARRRSCQRTASAALTNNASTQAKPPAHARLRSRSRSATEK